MCVMKTGDGRSVSSKSVKKLYHQVAVIFKFGERQDFVPVVNIMVGFYPALGIYEKTVNTLLVKRAMVADTCFTPNVNLWQ